MPARKTKNSIKTSKRAITNSKDTTEDNSDDCNHGRTNSALTRKDLEEALREMNLKLEGMNSKIDEIVQMATAMAMQSKANQEATETHFETLTDELVRFEAVSTNEHHDIHEAIQRM